ncbi:hypothetical protein [Flavobacterium panici]|uniref:hypothetical protein n=1 Tax=Flavobacterium panici TaxID=2654843 RepID=UPI002114C561|nr:hypothetical protein [Flavobacterium panici]UUF12356.1 hypothetical protein NLJ00_13955 [Flavobacterium panici]
MKRLKKVLMSFLFFGTIVLVAGCDNEENDTGQLISQNAKIGQAKNWFENYKSNSTTNKSEEGEFNKAFRNLDYYWENAKVIQLSDNSTGITVPIKDNPEDPDYKGQKMLYLYESDSKYQALIQEIFPESQDKIDDAQKKQGFEDLTFFSGYIIHWDFKKGFLKGAKLKEGLVIEDVQDVIMLFDKDHKHSSTSKMIEMFDESANYGGERDDTLQRGGTAAIPLNNVIVTQKSPAPAPRDFSIAGAFGGDGGSSGNSSTPKSGGGTGGSSGSDIKDVYPDCSSFNFIKLNGVPWQEAAVKNIRFNIVIIQSLTPLRTSTETIVLPQAVSFQMPTNTSIGNTDITSGIAASIAAKAVNTAMEKTKNYYKAIPATELMVDQFFRKTLKDEFEFMVPGSRLVLNPVSTVPPTEYRNNWFFSSNCN